MSDVGQRELNAQMDTLSREMLPELRDELVAFDAADGDERSQIEALIAEIDLKDANSVIFFGNKAQHQLNDVSDRMLEGVRNKDAGSAGSALNEMVAVIRGFDWMNWTPIANRESWGA